MLKIGLLAFGANLPSGKGSPRETVLAALDKVSNNKVVEIARSSLFETPAFPDPSGPRYINACMTVQTTLSAKALLKHIHEIEDTLGRTREQRWGARVIDIDLLALGMIVCPDLETHKFWAGLAAQDQIARTPDELILPHPRIADRGFVLAPLAQIAPLWRHPVTGLTAEEMLKMRPDAEIEAIEELQKAESACQG
ncbi:MAG: 2-amino-4-hydroxy-6-hydroxymethyldihydropteridine diphosphokinase [Pseudomonadota bacterium]